MRVLAFDPFVGAERYRELGVEKAESSDDVYAEADFLTLHLPKTPETEGWLDAEALAKCKDGVRVLNVARGPLIVDEDLQAALDSGKVGGAALDVFRSEPITDHPLFGYPNVDRHAAPRRLDRRGHRPRRLPGRRAGRRRADRRRGDHRGQRAGRRRRGPRGARAVPAAVPPARAPGDGAGRRGRSTASRSSTSGGIAERDTRPLAVAVLLGVLAGHTEEEVNAVNAPADRRASAASSVAETSRSDARDFTDLVRVTVRCGDRHERVVGTTLGRRHRPHLLEAWGQRFNLQLEDHLALFRYSRRAGHDRPRRHRVRRARHQHRLGRRRLRPRTRRGRSGDGRHHRPGRVRRRDRADRRRRRLHRGQSGHPGLRVTAHGWWLQEAGPAVPAAALEGEMDCDVVVIGGGYTGLWAAWHLAERGAAVALLESGICGEGPSGRNGGFADHLAHAAPRLRALAGDDAARATIAESIASVRAIGAWCEAQGVDAWFRPGGQLVASAAPAQDGGEDEAVAACAALGLGDELQALTAADVRARIASPVLRGGVFAPSTATVHPARLARGLRARLLDRGVRVFEHTRVRALREGPAGVVAETASGRVRAKAAVLAMGPRSVALAPLRRALTLTSSHILVTEPVPDVLEAIGWTGGEAVTDGRHLVHYFRTTPDGRIVFGWGGGRIVCGARLQPRDDRDRRLAVRVAADLVRFFPALAGRRVEHAWGGPIDASPAHLPVVDTLPGGRTHFAFGYTGNGVGPSELCGRDPRPHGPRRARRADASAHRRRRPRARCRPSRCGSPAARRSRIALDRKERAEEAGRRSSPVAARGCSVAATCLECRSGGRFGRWKARRPHQTRPSRSSRRTRSASSRASSSASRRPRRATASPRCSG